LRERSQNSLDPGRLTVFLFDYYTVLVLHGSRSARYKLNDLSDFKEKDQIGGEFRSIWLPNFFSPPAGVCA